LKVTVENNTGVILHALSFYLTCVYSDIISRGAY